MIHIQPDKDRLREHAKALRKAHESAGTTTEVGGATISVDTEGDDVAKLTGLFVRVQAGMQLPPLAFKGGGDFHHLTIEQFGAVVTAAANHINAGYAAEATVAAMIEDGTVRTRGEVAAAFAAAVADELAG